MTIDDLDELIQSLKRRGHGGKQAIVNITFGSILNDKYDTRSGPMKWGGRDVISIRSAPLLFVNDVEPGLEATTPLDTEELIQVGEIRKTAGFGVLSAEV